jgi:hypothetical protein
VKVEQATATPAIEKELLHLHAGIVVRRSRYFERQLKKVTAAVEDERGRKRKTVTVELETEKGVVIARPYRVEPRAVSHSVHPPVAFLFPRAARHTHANHPTCTHNAEAADFKRLIKLSYTPSYTKDGGRALGQEELMRVMVLGDRFKFKWCVEECAQALLPFNGYEEAAAYFNTVPGVLLGEARLQATTQAAGDALVAGLGRVEELWRPGMVDSIFMRETWPLDAKVTTLPLPAVETLLRSEQLQLKSENYAFSLAMWWIMEQEGSQEELQPLFDRLLGSLRFARMSRPFLASIVHRSWVKDSPMLRSVMACGLRRRNAVPRTRRDALPPSRVQGADRDAYHCTFTTSFTKAAIEAALRGPGDTTYAPLGLLHGFPCSLSLTRGDGDSYSLSVTSPFLGAPPPRRGPGAGKWAGEENDRKRGFKFVVEEGFFGTMDLEESATYSCRVEEDSDPILACSGAALVYDDDGKLEVEITIRIDQHSDC